MNLTDRHLIFWAERKLGRAPYTVSVHELIPRERRSKGEHHAWNLIACIRNGERQGYSTRNETLLRFGADGRKTSSDRRASFARKWLRRIQREEVRRERLRLGIVSHNLKIQSGFYVAGSLVGWPHYLLPQGNCSRKEKEE